MTFWMAIAHFYAAACAFGIAAVLQGAALSPEFRFLIGKSERERSYNFSVVSLFMFAICLDLATAPYGANEANHAGAIILACLTGTIALSMFAWRLRPWKT